MPLIRAKRAVEAMIGKGSAVVSVPMIESLPALADELAASGIETAAHRLDEIDVRGIRERSGLTQEDFALRFGLDLDTLQNWESGRRAMPRAVRSYMQIIDRIPEQASRALENTITRP